VPVEFHLKPYGGRRSLMVSGEIPQALAMALRVPVEFHLKP